MRCSRPAPDAWRLPIVDHPAGAVSAALLLTATCATMRLPLATEAGRVITKFVPLLVVVDAQPPPGHAATSAIGSTMYGVGSRASSSRSTSVCRRKDQRRPG